MREILERRSIRKYLDNPVSDKDLDELLRCAMAAPSAVAKDPWRFIVIKDDGLKKKVVEALPNGKMMAEAPVGIVVLGDINQAHGNELSYMLQDCSAAIQNLLLAASELGLGAVWLGVHPREERMNHIKEVFNLPENIIPLRKMGFLNAPVAVMNYSVQTPNMIPVPAGPVFGLR